MPAGARCGLSAWISPRFARASSIKISGKGMNSIPLHQSHTGQLFFRQFCYNKFRGILPGKLSASGKIIQAVRHNIRRSYKQFRTGIAEFQMHFLQVGKERREEIRVVIVIRACAEFLLQRFPQLVNTVGRGGMLIHIKIQPLNAVSM